MASDLCNVLKAGASVNFYMIHGGTNFGFLAGANWVTGKGYKPDVTSYGMLSVCQSSRLVISLFSSPEPKAQGELL